MTDTDIVTRLRGAALESYGCQCVKCEAAKEIERLREELTASHESHGNEVGALTERLSLAIHERDEARRDICEMEAMNVLHYKYNKLTYEQPKWSEAELLQEERIRAEEHGWDCFDKEIP